MNMGRWNFRDVATAGFFFILAAFLAWSFFAGFADSFCTLDATRPCSLGDMERRTWGLPITAGLAVLLFGMGIRVIWGMRHGEE
jgi:hypothetical protein